MNRYKAITGNGVCRNKENFDKLVNIGRGAALMTGTTMEMEPYGAAWPQQGNKAIAEAVQKNIEMVGMPKWAEEENKFAQELQKSLGRKEIGLPTKVEPLQAARQNSSSNDIGDVTWVVPTAPAVDAPGGPRGACERRASAYLNAWRPRASARATRTGRTARATSARNRSASRARAAPRR